MIRSNSRVLPIKMEETNRLSGWFESASRANGLGSVIVSNGGRNFICHALPLILDSGSGEHSFVPSEPQKTSEGNEIIDSSIFRVDPLTQNAMKLDQEKQALIRRGHDKQNLEFPEVSHTRDTDEEIRSSSSGQIRDPRTSCWMNFAALLHQPRIKGIILLNVLTILYGSNAAVIKQAETTVDPASFSTGRFLIATLAFSPYLWCALKDDIAREKGMQLGLLTSIGYLSQSVGLLTTDAGRAAFFCAFTVIVVPLLAGLSGSRIPRITWFSAIVALIGIGLLEFSGPPASVGDIWNLISAVSFGFHMLRSEHLSRALPSASILPLLSIQLLVTTLCSAIWSFCSHINQASAMDVLGWQGISSWQPVSFVPCILMLYTGLLSTAFCLWVEFVALRSVSSSEAVIIYTLEPLWGAGFAWFFLGERWGALEWIGALFILGGSLSMQLFSDAEVEKAGSPLPISLKRKEGFENSTSGEDGNGGDISLQRRHGSYNSHRARSKVKSKPSI